MKQVICFEAKRYNKLDLDKMTDEQRVDIAQKSMLAKTYTAWVVPLDEWVNQFNTGRTPPSGDIYIYLVDKEEDDALCLNANQQRADIQESEPIDKDEAWLFYGNVAKPQTKHYIKDYNGDMSVFLNPDKKTFWYEVWIDLEDNWVDGEQIYLKVKDMDLREVGKYLFKKLCEYESYYDSPAYIEDLNKMANAVFND